MNLLDRAKKLSRQTEEGCWVWEGSVDRGYPIFKKNGSKFQVQRELYTRRVGPIVEQTQYWISTSCGNDLCVNPEHLEKISRSERMEQAYEEGELDHLEEAAKKGDQFEEGHEPHNRGLSDKQAELICRAVENRRGEYGALRDIADFYDVSLDVVKDISRGATYTDIMKEVKEETN